MKIFVCGFKNLFSLAIGEVTKRQRDSIQSKRKIVKMLIAVVLIFGICW
jgi:tachykinin-like receptor